MSWLTVYTYASEPEVFLDTKNIYRLMRKLKIYRVSKNDLGNLDDLLKQIETWSTIQLGRYDELLRVARQREDQADFLNKSLIDSLPMASILGCFLQNILAASEFESKLKIEQAALFADDMGITGTQSSRYDEYKLLLGRFELQSYVTNALSSLPKNTIEDGFFALPAILLSLSRRPDTVGFELCGIDLLFRTVGMLPCWKSVAKAYPDWINWNRLDLSLAHHDSNIPSPLEVSRSVVAHYTALDQKKSARIRRAIYWGFCLLQQWNEHILDHLISWSHPDHAMTELIQMRAYTASTYHNAYALKGCPLSNHFQEAVHNPEKLVALLAQSNLVSPGNASKSVLINKIIGPNGKMFGVFTSRECRIIRNWIDGLSKQSKPTLSSGPKTEPVVFSVRLGDMTLGANPNNVRAAYCVLQGHVLAPKTRDFAVNYVRYWMKRAQTLPNQLPMVWSEDSLHMWLQSQHDRQNQQLSPINNVELPSLEQVISDTLKLAPLLLIDGAWLQGFSDIKFASSRVTGLLFKIYWDELGSGQYAMNHPKIYRDLLSEMGVQLPPTASMAFAFHPSLPEQSFWLPVLWLCLSKLPVTFLPEILGINLAIELSGIGNGYRHAGFCLKSYGFSTRFVDLHNSIDNIETGHSAWSIEAINQYMKAISKEDTDTLSTHWKRICCGFNAKSVLKGKIRKMRSPEQFNYATHQLLHYQQSLQEAF